MDVSLSKLMSSAQIKTLSFKTESGDETVSPTLIPVTSYTFSNLACSIVLEMLANGAAEGSSTLDILISHFHGKPLDWINQIFPLTLEFLTVNGNAGGPKINVARRVWVDPSIELKSAFLEAMGYYKPDFATTEFSNTEAVKMVVNEWIQEKTGGLVKGFLDSTVIGADSRLIFATALDFDGEWFEPFVDAGVQQFTLLNGDVVNLPFMTTTAKHYVQQFKNYKLLSVPFKQKEPSRFSMLFYLPDAIQAFGDLMSFIGMEEISILDVYFPEEQVQVGNFLIPKFSLSQSGPMPFNPPLDFQQLENSSTGLISPLGVLSCYLEINEKGTRAAGVAGFLVDKKPTERDSGEVAPSDIKPIDANIDFVANRPFIIFIRDNLFGRMLFSGALINPASQSA